MAKHRVWIAREVASGRIVSAWYQSAEPPANPLGGYAPGELAVEAVPEDVVTEGGGPIAWTVANVPGTARRQDTTGIRGSDRAEQFVASELVGEPGGIAQLGSGSTVPDSQLAITIPRLLAALESDVAITGSGEQTVVSIQVPGGFLGSVGMLMAEILVTAASPAAGYTARWSYGGDASPSETSSAATLQRHALRLWARGTDQEQLAFATRLPTGASPTHYDADLTVDSSANQTLSFLVTLDNGSDTFTFRGLLVWGFRGTIPA